MASKKAIELCKAHRTELVADDKHIFDHCYFFSKFGISILRARKLYTILTFYY